MTARVDPPAVVTIDPADLAYDQALDGELIPAKRRRGRKPGVKNKYPRELREMIRQALDEAGGVQYLVRQAHENPVAFMALLAKSMPRDTPTISTGMVDGKIAVAISWQEPDSEG